MRLLLLLSALFTALAGAVVPRAEAQPVQASAAALAPVAAAVARAPLAVRLAGAAFGRPPLQPPLPRLVGAAAARLLYAERRRE